MLRMEFIVLLIFAPVVSAAQEPGYLRNEELKDPPKPKVAPAPKPKVSPPPMPPPLTPPPDAPVVLPNPAPQPRPAPKSMVRTMMSQEFDKAKGLTAGDIRSMHYSRVACQRRMYSPDGWLINGDADIKVTNVAGDYLEAEMPAHFSFVAFGGFNPYMNGVSEVSSAMAMQLLNIKTWPERRPMKLKKFVEVRFVDENRRPQIVQAIDEVRIMADGYPPTYLVRETIFTDEPFSLYFFCQ